MHDFLSIWPIHMFYFYFFLLKIGFIWIRAGRNRIFVFVIIRYLIRRRIISDVDHDDVEREGYTIYRWNICTGGNFVFRSTTPTVFFPVRIRFILRSPHFVILYLYKCHLYKWALHVPHITKFYQVYMAFIWAFKCSLHHSIPSYTQLVNFVKKKNLQNCNLLVFILFNILDQGVWFPHFGQESNSFNFFDFIYTWISTNGYAGIANLQYYI